MTIGFGTAAQDAVREAIATLESLGENVERNTTALHLYAQAVDRADRARRQWEDEGCPMLSYTLHGTPIQHPLVKIMREEESAAAARGKTLGLDPHGRVALGKRGKTGKLGDRSPDKTARARPGVTLRAVDSA